MSEPPSPPIYYEGKSLADMEAMLRRRYLSESGWLESAESRLPMRAGTPLPWFTYAAIEFLERNVDRAVSVFEFGAGHSTLYWADRVGAVSSVEHDAAYVAYLRERLPGNVSLELIEEGAAVRTPLRTLVERIPEFDEPPRTEQTVRRGQVLDTFRGYALEILMEPLNAHDIVVVDGMARTLCTWAAIRSFRRDGFIVFDNSDRDEYREAYALLERSGYRRIDFWGLGPINPYGWCTSIFYQASHFTGTRWFTGEQGAETGSRTPGGLGILVIGYNRPHHLQAVLESLRQQDALSTTHVWIDGTQGRGEFLDDNRRTVEIARRYRTAELSANRGHLGVEKMMLDALSEMTRRYDRVLVLEDDCFPTDRAIHEFEEALAETRDDRDIFSVYGHPFGTEPEATRRFARFQGWGWAAHSDRILELLPELRALFSMSENEYLDTVRQRLTPEIEQRLDRTGERNVLKVLGRFFSWDSAIAFLCAERGLEHYRTRQRVIRNTGITEGIGHFRQDSERFRAAPFNLITLQEAWDHFDTRTPPCAGERESYGLDQLDRRIVAALPEEPGFLIEIGAHDGVKQSNSVLLEQRGWRGLLVEALPAEYARCRAARPGMIVEHAACVSSARDGGYLTVIDSGLMSLGVNSSVQGDEREAWLRRGEGFAGRPRQPIEVRATTLSKLLDKHQVDQVDLLILDVEGAEVDVLDGLDFDRHAPRFIVAEDAYNEDVGNFLGRKAYRRSKVLLERRFTRDCLYVR